MKENVDSLIVGYKFTTTMPIIRRTYKHFISSLYEKHKLFLTGKIQLHILPFFTFDNKQFFIQPIFDFDDTNDKHELIAFAKSELMSNFIKENDIFVELTPHGFHIGIKRYIFGPFTKEKISILRDWCKSKFLKYTNLDITSSIRFMCISRAPGVYKQKRIIAIDFKDFKNHSINKLRVLQIQMQTISLSTFQNQINQYVSIKQVITDVSKYPRFLKDFAKDTLLNEE